MHEPHSILGCPTKLVCRCLKVSEEMLVEILATMDLNTIKEIRSHTGAGDGCNACHRLLKKYLEKKRAQASEVPICSAK